MLCLVLEVVLVLLIQSWSREHVCYCWHRVCVCDWHNYDIDACSFSSTCLQDGDMQQPVE